MKRYQVVIQGEIDFEEESAQRFIELFFKNMPQLTQSEWAITLSQWDHGKEKTASSVSTGEQGGSLSKKLYIRTAEIIRRYHDQPEGAMGKPQDTKAILKRVAEELADMFNDDNRAFDYQRFFDACGIVVD
jgi:hypothetical protein